MPLLTGLPNSNKTQPYSVWWYGGRRGRRSKGLEFLPSPFLGELAIPELEFALLSLQQEDFDVFVETSHCATRMGDHRDNLVG